MSSAGIKMFLECCIKLIKILLLHSVGRWKAQYVLTSTTFFVLMTHVNASSHISNSILDQDFVLFVPVNSTDIVVKVTECQKKYIIYLQVQV